MYLHLWTSFVKSMKNQKNLNAYTHKKNGKFYIFSFQFRRAPLGKTFLYGVLDSRREIIEKPIAEGKIEWLMRVMKTPEEFRKKLISKID